MTDTPNPLVNVKDLAGLSGPAKTLIEKVSGAVGAIFEPHQIKRVAKAKADAAIIEAQTEIEITDLHRRAAYRWLEEEAQRQKNIEDITMQALPHLAENTDASKMDNDWITNFFDKARIISDADMQKLWSRLLAEEANKPGCHSKRAVNVLGDMDKNDAEIFTKLCRFCCMFGNITPIILNYDDEIYQNHSISFANLSHLESIGLIHFNIAGEFKKMNLPKQFSIHYYGVKLYLAMQEDDNNELITGVVMLTKVGKELYSICGSLPIDGFIEYIKNKWSAFSPSDSI